MTDNPLPPIVDVAVALITRGEQILICRRPVDKPLGGYWEFPGGKRNAPETLQECVIREIREELGIVITPLQPLAIVEHRYDHARVRIHPFLCQLTEGDPRPIQADAIQWVQRTQLKQFKFPPANAPILRQLIDNT